VPLLRHDDFLLTENVAILHYLAELYPSAGLLGGATPRSRAEVLRWLAFLNSDVHGAFMPLFALQKMVDVDPATVERAAAARRQVRRYLVRLDGQLEGRDWLVGTRSVADPYLFVIFRWSVTTGVDFEGLPNLAAFAERMFVDDGVRAALFAEGALLF
jgi:glutathione S-transferase